MRHTGARSSLILLGVLSSAVALAQAPDYGGKDQKEAMKKLAMMVGTWKGEGFYEVGGARRPFHGVEIVSQKCEGAILSVEGNHTMTVGGREIPVHSAFGVIYFDVAKKVYQMTAHLANGLSNTYDMKPNDTGYTWAQDHPTMGKVRYTATITSDTWTEIGESEKDGKWTVFYKMDLKRSKD